MNDLPPGLPRPRTLETWLAMSLERVRRTIVEAERREAEQRHGQEHRPPAPDRLIEMCLGGRDPVYVDVGGCHMAGNAAASSEIRLCGP
ncbi:hypothetical protein ACFRAO_07275 [Streptomyces sp. NPDC056656]|uniref:hypothetical protein n=1 Tax=Streptomyces sp. NPDC056656 TaxID=3345895 RepID=UPI00368CEF6B